MNQGIHNFSEIGKLNKVLLHRPGQELEALTPNTLDRLLFDDIPYLRIAQQEHDCFAQLLRDNGAEVVYYVDELAKVVENEQTKERLARDFIALSDIYSERIKDALLEYFLSLPARAMIEKMISGVLRSEITLPGDCRLLEFIAGDYPFVSDPMPNLYFTRDPGACVGRGINVHRMHTEARRREALLLKYIFMFDRDFSAPDNKLWYDVDGCYSIEGGDVLVLSKDVVAVGLSQRTTPAGAESFATKLLRESGFKKVLVFDIPKSRAFMHLDTVFTMVDYDKFTIHHEIEGPLSVYELSPGKKTGLEIRSMTKDLKDILAAELNLPAVELIRCGGGDTISAQREQWNDGSNTLCIAPGTVVTYERNYITNEQLDSCGIKVLTIPSAELSRGRGGPRCMSCPVNRDDL